jgi:hypothetical protein
MELLLPDITYSLAIASHQQYPVDGPGPLGNAAVKTHRVAIVLDPAFGDRLIDLSSTMHAWIVGTPENSSVAERIWKQHPEHRPGCGVTTMAAEGYETPCGLFSQMLDAVDEHHGWHSHDPPWTELHVYGIPATTEVVGALARYHAAIENEHNDYFVASRSAPPRPED